MTYAGTWQEPANEPGPTSNYWSSAKQTAALVFLALWDLLADSKRGSDPKVCVILAPLVQVTVTDVFHSFRLNHSSSTRDLTCCRYQVPFPVFCFFFSLQLFLQFLAADSNLESSCSLPLAAGIRPNHLHRREHSPTLRPVKTRHNLSI